MIHGPLPWKNGPPVRTPQPGAPIVKAPSAPRPNGIMRKLGVHEMTGLMHAAARMGLVEL